MNEDQQTKEDLEKILCYLETNKPERANMKEAVRLYALMQKFAEELVGEDIEFAELLLKALNEEKSPSEEDVKTDEHSSQ